jgi:hypothetical protein
MKRQIFTLLIALLLATGTALLAQTAYPTQVPPSQQVDQTGQPETGSGPDVDVDAGRNAEDGVVDVEVNRTTDSDTAAQGNDPNPTVGTTGTTSTTGAYDTDADNDNLPDTASGLPLLGLIGLAALAGAATIKAVR